MFDRLRTKLHSLGGDSRPGYLFVLSSGNQLYSGIGTALFEWIRFAKGHFRFGILIDGLETRNVRIAQEFCAAQQIKLIVEASAPKPGAPDPGVARVGYHLTSGEWPFIELLSWANASTNLDVVSSIDDTTTLIFTPYTQPLWTIPNSDCMFLAYPVDSHTH